MLHQVKLDVPGTFHRNMTREIERSPKFKGDQYQQDYISRAEIIQQLGYVFRRLPSREE
jgi:hypothetical protein